MVASYAIVRAISLGELAQQVNKLIADGFSPLGGPFLTNPAEQRAVGYAQAVIGTPNLVAPDLPAVDPRPVSGSATVVKFNVVDTSSESLHTFLDVAAGEGLVLGGVDAADLYQKLFPARFAAAIARAEKKS